jgi:hypothetical protein
MMKNPLCKYEKHIDVIEFLKNNFQSFSSHIEVPYAKNCYFYTPLFFKFDFHLNFSDEAVYFFWDIFKKKKSLLLKAMDSFNSDDLRSNKELTEIIMFKESRPLFKALLYLFLSDENYKKNFTSALSLNLDRVRLFRQMEPDYSNFAMHVCIDNFSINDDAIIKTLNRYKSKIVVANNPIAQNYIVHDHKIDFKESYVLVSSA